MKFWEHTRSLAASTERSCTCKSVKYAHAGRSSSSVSSLVRRSLCACLLVAGSGVLGVCDWIEVLNRGVAHSALILSISPLTRGRSAVYCAHRLCCIEKDRSESPSCRKCDESGKVAGTTNPTAITTATAITQSCPDPVHGPECASTKAGKIRDAEDELCKSK